MDRNTITKRELLNKLKDLNDDAEIHFTVSEYLNEDGYCEAVAVKDFSINFFNKEYINIHIISEGF